MGVDDKLKLVEEAYRDAISKIRARLPDDVITDVLERYVHGGYDRDEAMEILDIDFLGTLYELTAVFQIKRPEPDPEEDARQTEMMRLLLDGQEVPVALRQPAAWRKH